jgi:hypothetical protein
MSQHNAGWTTGLASRLPLWAQIFLSALSISGLGFVQRPIKWTLGLLPGSKAAGSVKLITHLRLKKELNKTHICSPPHVFML